MSGGWNEREPSEERGQAVWAAGAGEQGSAPPWASAETQTFSASPFVPAPVPVFGPAPPPAPRPHRLLAVLLLAVVIGASVGVGVWVLTRDRTDGAGGSPAGIASPSAGYRTAQDPIGYTVTVPEDWTRRQKQGQLAPVVYYDAPAGDGRQLQIFQLAENSPALSLDLAENDPGYGFALQPGYQVLDRGAGADWSELVYRYDDEDKGPRHVIDHRFRATDGKLYAIRLNGPEDLSPEQVREPLTTAVTSFCPADGNCG